MEIKVTFDKDKISLPGVMNIPDGARGIVLFAHGSGSSRLSTRNNYVAKAINQSGMATFLFDLLTEEEDATYENRFNIDLLTKRLEGVVRWCKDQDASKKLAIGLFGASTGAAAALRAAADMPDAIAAVVSRGGRPDLAGAALPKVKSPVLLIVGGLDTEVIELNQEAYEKLGGVRKMEIVDGATHLFEEPGTLEKVTELAASWFKKKL